MLPMKTFSGLSTPTLNFTMFRYALKKNNENNAAYKSFSKDNLQYYKKMGNAIRDNALYNSGSPVLSKFTIERYPAMKPTEENEFNNRTPDNKR